MRNHPRRGDWRNASHRTDRAGRHLGRYATVNCTGNRNGLDGIRQDWRDKLVWGALIEELAFNLIAALTPNAG